VHVRGESAVRRPDTARADLDPVRAAFEAEHAPLWRAVAAWSGSTDVADEAVAETFAQLVRRGSAVKDPSAWAWRTAFRVAAAELQRRRLDAPMDVGDVALPAGASDQIVDLMHALQFLSRQQRACVVVCDLLGFSPAEAAALLHTSAATVRVQRMRARRRLRKQLEVRDA
jgi:RNA polymerase sigma-70 factor (ECF subfamily)